MAICGTTSAATPQKNSTISHNNTTTISTLQLTSKSTTKKAGSAGDPIINGTVTINEYGSIRNLANATVTINSTNGRTLAITKTNANGFYSTNFYSTNTQFIVTTSYLGCDPVTNTVTVKLSTNPNDPNYYGTSNAVVTPIQAWWNGNYGYASNIYITYYNGNFNAGEIETATNSGSTIYNSYCIDIYTEINPNNILLINGPLPGTTGNLSAKIDWGAVNYVISHYNPSSPSQGLTSDQMGAAIQSAIWALTTVQYPNYSGTPNVYYHFLTAPNDALDPSGGSAIRNEALAIASDASAHSMLYPSTISLTPKITRIANGQPVTITATVLDNKGNPLSGITVNFQTTSGTLSSTTRITDSNGQATVTLSNIPSSSSVTVTASVSGNFGNLLYDNPLVPKQNLVAENILPQSLLDISIINSDVTANVALSQTVNLPVNVGDKITYTVTAKNNGPNSATGVIINDVIPSGFTATPSIGTYYNGTWVIASLTSGSSATLTISGTAIANMAGTYVTNTATETGQDQYTSQLPTTAASSYVNDAVLTIINTGTTPVNVGQTGTFTITATNNGPDTANNIKITDALPAGFTAGTPTIGTYSNGIWTINSLTNGQTATLTFTKTITAAMAKTTTTNHATATWTEYPNTVTIPDSTIYVNQLAITNTGTTPVNVGQIGTFKITVTNNGPTTARNIKITDPLPAGFTATTTSGSYSSTTGLWTITSLIKGTTATLTFTKTITAAMAGTTTTNHATTTWTEYTGTNSIPDSIIHVNKAVLSISNTGTNPVNVGQTGTYTITATNNGPQTATNIQINDPTPTGYTADTPSIGSYTGGIWTIPTLTNGQTATLTFTKTITTADAGTSTTNHATATWTEYPNTITIPDTTINVNKMASVTITNTGTNPVNVGQTGTYTITATNNGPQTATNIQINDPTPTGYTADTPSIGSYTGGIWTIPTLTNGQTATLTFTKIMTTADAGTSTTNHATATWTEYPTTTIIPNSTIYVKLANVVLSQNGSYKKNNVTFIVTATNNGPDDATKINIKDLIPSSLTNYTIIPDVGTYDSGTGIWYIPLIASGTIANLNITGTGTLQTKINNTATEINQTEYNTNLGTCKSSVYIPAVDISVSDHTWNYIAATDSYQDTYTYGNTPLFMMEIANLGPDDATGVVVQFIIPKGFEYVAYSTRGIGTATYQYDNTNQNGIVTFNIGSLPRSGSAVLNVFLRIIETGNKIPDLTTIGQLIHVDQNDTNNTNNISTFAINTPPSADIKVSQTPKIFTGSDGKQYVTYTIQVTNNGPNSATGLTITDKLPSGLIYSYNDISTNGGQDWTHNTTTYNSTSGVWTIGNFNIGDQPKLLNITAQITGTGIIKNYARKSAETENDWDSTNNAQTIPINVPTGYTSNVDISVSDHTWNYIAATDSYQDTYTYGNTPLFMMEIANLGPDDATGVVVQFIIPKGFEYVAYSTRGIGTATYQYDNTNQNGIVTFNIGSLPRSGSAVLNVFLRIIETGNKIPDLTTIGQLIHVDQNDTNNTNNISTFAINTPPSADIKVNTTQNTFTGSDGKQYVTITIQVTNNGPNSATGLTITDKLPSGLIYSYNDISTNGGQDWTHNTTTYNSTSGVWTIGNFNIGDQPKLLNITAQITGTGIIKNYARKSAETENDWDSTNNAQTITLSN